MAKNEDETPDRVAEAFAAFEKVLRVDVRKFTADRPERKSLERVADAAAAVRKHLKASPK